MIVLTPLEDAIRNGHNIHAVTRHTGTNQDGKTNGPTMPSLEVQKRLIKSVYSQAGLDPCRALGSFEESKYYLCL